MKHPRTTDQAEVDRYKPKALDVLLSDKWRWWTYSDVARALDAPSMFATVHVALEQLVTVYGGRVYGRTSDPKRRRADQFRAWPKDTTAPMGGERTKAERVKNMLPYVLNYVREHPHTTRADIERMVRSLRGSCATHDIVLAIDALVHAGVIERDETRRTRGGNATLVLASTAPTTEQRKRANAFVERESLPCAHGKSDEN